MNIHQWQKHVRGFNDSFDKDSPTREEWNKNTAENLPRFNADNSIWNLEYKYYQENEKGMVLVGSSPCLERDVEKLKSLDDNFRIICANSSLKYLLRHGIRPHYCICLDSDGIDIPQHLDCDSSGITLLSSSVVCKKALDSWKGPIYFSPYYSINKELRPKLRAKLGRKVMTGGNSITQALITATVIMGSKTIIFVANEYCFDKRYYADKTAAKQEVLNTIHPITDIAGKQRWTLPALYTYAVWTEKVCTDLTPPGFFIDTSFGILGKDTKAIHSIELSKAIDVVKGAFAVSKKVREAKRGSEKLRILKEIIPKHDESKVLRYNVSEQREKLLQIARS